MVAEIYGVSRDCHAESAGEGRIPEGEVPMHTVRSHWAGKRLRRAPSGGTKQWMALSGN